MSENDEEIEVEEIEPGEKWLLRLTKTRHPRPSWSSGRAGAWFELNRDTKRLYDTNTAYREALHADLRNEIDLLPLDTSPQEIRSAP